MPDRKPLTDDEIISWIGNKLAKCLNEDGDDISKTRQDNFDRYMGEPYGDERKGYSKVVTRECLEAVEWALPSIIRVFTAGDQVVVFDPVGQEDEEAAEQETDVVNFYLNKNGNNAFTLFYEWFKDALMYPNGYVKAWVEEQEKVTSGRYDGITAVGLATLMQREGIEVVEQESIIDFGQDGAAIELFNVKVRQTTKKKRLIVQAVPGEQVAVDADATSLDMDECDFVCHRVKRSQSYLREMGVPQSFLDAIPCGDAGAGMDGEEENRKYFIDEEVGDDDDGPGLKTYWVNEAYCRLDADSDGIAERRRIITIGDRVWENEEDDYQPFVAVACMLMQHKHTGLDLLSSMKDLQRVSTTLLRQLLDNVYAINNRRKFVGEGALVDGGATISALNNPLADIVPTRDPSQIVPEVIPSVAGDILPVMDVIAQAKKVRTGVAPELSLDPEILQQSTMGAFANALDQANQKLELITRTFAETGVRRLMLKVHRLLRENMDVQQTIKLRNKWVEVDPSAWVEREDMTPNVGLGFNSKEKTAMAMTQLMQIQRELLLIGATDPKKIYNAASKFVESIGLKTPDMYVTDPTSTPPQPPKPDPALHIAQMQFQIDQERLQLERQKLALQAQEQQGKDRERYMKLENDLRDIAAKYTELELKYSTNVPGSVV